MYSEMWIPKIGSRSSRKLQELLDLWINHDSSSLKVDLQHPEAIEFERMVYISRNPRLPIKSGWIIIYIYIS